MLGDAAAEQAGIVPGTAASPPHERCCRQSRCSRAAPSAKPPALHSLACAAGRLTPRISLLPDALLLEIGSCLRLFGGVERIVAMARDDARAQQFTVATAVAPTPLGAYWLAGYAQPSCDTKPDAGRHSPLCLDRTTLHRWLDHLPVDVLPKKAATALARFGLRRLARRPPAAFIRAGAARPAPRYCTC